MRLALVLAIILSSSTLCLAQNSFSLNTTTGLNFSFATAASLEVNQTKSNAFILTVNPKSSNISLYVSIYNYAAPSGFDGSSMNLQLDYTTASSTSGVTNLVTNALTLSLADQRLFSIYKKNQNYNLYYNLICTAPGYDTPTGHYNFTLKFTMTAP